MILSICLGETPVNMWGLNTFSFSLGMAAASKKMMGILKSYKVLPLVCGFLFVLIFISYYIIFGNSNLLLYRNPIKSILSLLFLVYFFGIVCCLEKMIEKLKLLQNLGELSYEAYMIHAPFIFIFPEFFSLASKAIMIPIFLILTVLLAEILHIGINSVMYKV